MQCVTRPRITELNPHLLCVLCGGYYIDATAITECLHTFCKSCIVRYLETRKYCPICDVLVHKTKPLQSLIPDTGLQSIVYKLVPNLYEKEMRNRRNYYANIHTSLLPQNDEEKGIITESSTFFCNNDYIDFTLEYVNYDNDQQFYYVVSNSRRYLRCQACVTMEHVRKLIEAKYNVTMKHEIRFFYNEIQLPEHLTLLDIAYMSAWKRRGFINLFFDIKLAVLKPLTESKPQPEPTVTVAVSLSVPHSIITAIASANTPPPTPPPSTEALSFGHGENIVSISAEKLEQMIDVKFTKEQSPVSAGIVPTTTADLTPNSLASDPDEIGSTSSSVSPGTSSSTSAPSVTVTCSMNSDSITVASVGAPITTSSCEATVNGLTSSLEREIVESRTAEMELSSRKITENSVEKVSEEPTNKDAMDVVEEKIEKPLDPPTPVERLINSVVADDIAKTIPSDRNSDNSAEILPSPVKIPKLSELAVKVTPSVAQSVTKSQTLTVRTTVSTTCVPISSVSAVTYSTPSMVALSPLKTSATVAPLPRLDPLPRNSPRPIFTRTDTPIITKSTTKIMKSFTRPWNCASASSADGTNDKSSKSTKIIKARPTPPRYFVNPVSGARPMYEATTVTMSSSKSTISSGVAEDTKKSAKIFPVMKIDPQTLSPISAPSTTSCGALSSSSSTSPPVKKVCSSSPYPPYLPVTSELYTSSGSGLYTNSSLSTCTPSKPPAAYMMHNSILPYNQLMYEMYANGGNRTLDYMKAMATNLCSPPMFHPSMSAFYGSLPRGANSKYEKTSSRGGGGNVKVSDKSPPAVQRIPPSNNNTKLAVNEHSNVEKRHTSSVSKLDNVSNGQLNRSNNKRMLETNSSFSINNLIPLEMEKLQAPSHSCSADGVHQICDQRGPPAMRNRNGEHSQETKAVAENKMNNVRKE